jgi:hypothetical protein
MPKIIRKSNFRVLVEPKRLGDYGSIRTSDSFLRKPEQIEKDYQRRCDDIVDQIKRHVDEVGDVSVDFDTESVCSHCGREWEEDENGEPVCCDSAIAEHNQSKESVK